MKYLSLILIISSLHSLAFASDFTVTTDDPEIDFSSLDKNILIKIEKNELPTIKAERFRMQQLFLNIISNAVNYMDKPLGIIQISFEEEKKHYIFAIKDNGPGIAAENQEKIFKIFI